MPMVVAVFLTDRVTGVHVRRAGPGVRVQKVSDQFEVRVCTVQYLYYACQG